MISNILRVAIVCVIVFITSSLGKVTVLDSGNFDKLVYQRTHTWLLEFYAPWCSYCKQLAPTYEAVGVYLEEQGQINVGKIDCDVNEEICSRFDIKVYPTIKLTEKGKVHDFKNSTKSIESIKVFVNNVRQSGGDLLPGGYRHGPSAVSSLGIETFNEITYPSTTTAGWLVEFFKPTCGNCIRFNGTLQKLARYFEQESNVRVGAVNCDEDSVLCGEFNMGPLPTVIYVQGAKFWVFSGNRTTSRILDFVEISHNTTSLHKVPVLYGKYHQEIRTAQLYLEAFEEVLAKHILAALGIAFLYGLFLGWFIFRAPPPQFYHNTISYTTTNEHPQPAKNVQRILKQTKDNKTDAAPAKKKEVAGGKKAKK